MLTQDKIKAYKEIDNELSKLVHLYFDEFIKCDSSYCLEDWCIRNTEYNEVEINYTCTDHNNNHYYESSIATLEDLNRMIEGLVDEPQEKMVSLEKVEEWLYKNFYESYNLDDYGKYDLDEPYITSFFNTISEMFDDFRKTM